MTDHAAPGQPAPDPEIARLRQELEAAEAHARRLEHELGRLRGRVVVLEAGSWWRTTWRRGVKAVAYRLGRRLDR